MHPVSRAAILMALALPLPALAADFNCWMAKSKAEILICSDSGLFGLDDELNAAYRQAISTAGDKRLLVEWQRDWLHHYLNPCNKADCVKDVITRRIAMLKRVAPKDSPTAIWNGSYLRNSDGKSGHDEASLILVGLDNGEVYILGYETWEGPDWQNGEVHAGSIDGVGTADRQSLKFEQGDCKGHMSITGDRLVVDDESGCGGDGVTFVGEYRRK